MSKKIKVKSPANIAFVKYWGQRDLDLVLPFNDSFSMNLSNCYVIVELEKKEVGKQRLFIKDYQSKEYVEDKGKALEKVKKFYQTAKKFLESKEDFGFVIKSSLTFPRQAGIASSAAFFSALALAFTKAFGKELSTRELSILARLSGSGSACRSVSDGFVWWYKGEDFLTSFSESIADPSFWELYDLVLILNYERKKTTSQQGHEGATTSPFFKFRLEWLNKALKEIKKAFFEKDLEKFGEILEKETINLHSVMMSQKEPLFYWSGATLEVLRELLNLRKKGVLGYFTIDAGENVHVITEGKFKQKILEHFERFPVVREIIVNNPTIGARVL